MATRNYELMFILNPELKEEEKENLLGRIRGYLDEAQGQILNTEKWGMRRLAYRINGHKEGEYYLLHFAMNPLNVAQFERSLLLAEGILRELITRLDELPKSDKVAAPPTEEPQESEMDLDEDGDGDEDFDSEEDE